MHKGSPKLTRRASRRVVAIEGGISSGKSTLLKRLAEERPDLAVVPEPVDVWTDSDGVDMLKAMYEGTMSLSSFQMMALGTLCNSVTAAFLYGETTVVTERSPLSNLHVFAEKTLVGKEDRAAYKAMYQTFMKAFRNVDFHVLYLKTSAETQAKRVAERGRDGESSISQDYLADINSRHDAFLLNCFEITSMRVLDGEACTETVVEEALRFIDGVAPAFEAWDLPAAWP